jgi:hypothetical protein
MEFYNIYINVQRPDISIAGRLLKEPIAGTTEDIQEAFNEMQDLLAKGALNHFVLYNADARSATGCSEIIVTKAFYSADNACVVMHIEED